MNYSEATIKALTNSFEEDDEAYKWLIDHNFQELAAFRDFMKYDNSEALKWLENKKQLTILRFIDALQGDEKSLKNLLDNNEKALAATAAAVNKDLQAYIWLGKNNFKYFMPLVNVLMPEPRQRYVNRRGLGLGFSLGSDDFSSENDSDFQFGGGDFGGSGSDGKW